MHYSYSIPIIFSFASSVVSHPSNTPLDLSWHAPPSTKVSDLNSVINGTDVWGFVFNSSMTPAGLPYSTYNWCNMPHVRASEYPKVNSSYKLEYVHIIHRHHKRTPYAANTFPREPYAWECSDEGLYYHAAPFTGANANSSASTYWSVFTSASNPLAPEGFNGTCQFPQLTSGGLDDSHQHGRDVFGVYHSLLGFLPAAYDAKKMQFRVTNNVITSQVASNLIPGMFPSLDGKSVPLLIQPDSIDSLEPGYTCSSASSLYSSYGVGSTNANWTKHLTASSGLANALDAISGVSSSAKDWHQSWDHYFDNLSARLCHSKPLPCNATTGKCVTPTQANEVFRLGEYEYNYLYRTAGPQTLEYARRSYGIWVAELADHLRTAQHGNSSVIYRHDVAHDGSISRLLALLQIQEMVWPGMGSEVIFELYSKHNEWFVRILWSGQVSKSSSPALGHEVDMVPLDNVLAYFDGLVGRGASLIPGLCNQS
ncbi:hypothetical protein D6C98_04166 [Aureobasidium pullulans]|uniref:Phosphoglycerate mutase-like protein n=1 Tax=Aureobasidium pullulans TaxID=5580 RepID=A0A4S8W338_AURPU|nr:hypothetical protein D6D29_09634 [Aureobasidium pullulans]THW19513.1 hypothetical protein D6D24_02823 [Aureobasidium pullulans]THY55485.1 hypothetical protein D6C98_04166 [Aureobasidium pullulans]